MRWLGPGGLANRGSVLIPGDEIPGDLLTPERTEFFVDQGCIDLEDEIDIEIDAEDPEIQVDVGVMEVTVSPGEDGKLGTDDDETNIKPKQNGKKKKKKGGKS